MIPLRALPAVVLLVAAVPRLVWAQQPANPAASQMDPSERAAARVDPTVNNVVSGGRWRGRGKSGSYRVIEVSQGWETIRRRVFVQWLWDDDESPRGPRTIVAAWRELGSLAPDQFSLMDPALSWQNDRWHVTVKAASAPMEQPSETLTFVLGAPGEVQVVGGR